MRKHKVWAGRVINSIEIYGELVGCYSVGTLAYALSAVLMGAKNAPVSDIV